MRTLPRLLAAAAAGLAATAVVLTLAAMPSSAQATSETPTTFIVNNPNAPGTPVTVVNDPNAAAAGTATAVTVAPAPVPAPAAGTVTTPAAAPLARTGRGSSTIAGLGLAVVLLGMLAIASGRLIPQRVVFETSRPRF